MSLVYNLAKKLIADGSLDLLTDTIKVMLVGSTYTEDADHDYVNPSAYLTEISGTGYAGGYGGSGRKTLASKTVTEDDANDRAEFDAANLTWTSINAGTPAGAILIRERAATGDTMSELIAFIDSGGFPIVTNGGDLSITWDAEGILNLT
jgi:hypothetical protein